MPTHKAIHICNRYSQRSKAKIAKEYVLPTLKTGREKEKKGITKCINHWAISG